MKYLRVLPFLICICLMSGCQQDVQSAEITQDWKKAYLDVIEDVKTENSKYALLYIDDNDIPELLISYPDKEFGGKLYTFYDNAPVLLTEWYIYRDVAFSAYSEKTGQFLLYSNGGAGFDRYDIYLLKDGKTELKSTLETTHTADGPLEFTQDGNPVSEEEFNHLIGGDTPYSFINYEEISSLLK